MPPPVDDAAEALATFQDRLKQLEDQLLQLNVGGQPVATGAGTSSTGAQPTIRVSVPREKRFGKYSGARDDRILDDWIADADRAVRGQADAEAIDTLLFHLEDVAKEEVKLRPTSEWSSPSGVFQILREAFSEQLTETQARSFGEIHSDFLRTVRSLFPRKINCSLFVTIFTFTSYSRNRLHIQHSRQVCFLSFSHYNQVNLSIKLKYSDV